MLANPSLYFYRHYFDGLPDGLSTDSHLNGRLTNEGEAAKRNELLTAQQYAPSTRQLPLCDQSFSLTTGYPGLLIGLGYPHGNEVDGAIKLGCHFDHTTGLPTIPGSTVKGLLRHHLETYWDLVKPTDLAGDDRKTFIKAVFEGPGNAFLDAWPIRADESGRLFGIEFITPHNTPPKIAPFRPGSPAPRPATWNPDDYRGLTEPNPLPMLKVRPGVTYIFRFHLPQAVGQVNPEQLLAVFRDLLVLLGAGAKTNLSFGVLTEPEDPTIQDMTPTILQAR